MNKGRMEKEEIEKERNNRTMVMIYMHSSRSTHQINDKK